MPDDQKPPEQKPNRLFEERKVDYEAARLRDTGQDYESFLKEAKARALSQMQGKNSGRDR